MSDALQVYHNIIQHCVSKKLYEVLSPDFENKANRTAWAVQNNGNWSASALSLFGEFTISCGCVED